MEWALSGTPTMATREQAAPWTSVTVTPMRYTRPLPDHRRWRGAAPRWAGPRGLRVGGDLETEEARDRLVLGDAGDGRRDHIAVGVAGAAHQHPAHGVVRRPQAVGSGDDRAAVRRPVRGDAQQCRHVRRARVGDHEVACAVRVRSDRGRERVGPRGVCGRRPEAAVACVEQHRHVVRTAVGHDDVRTGVAVEPGDGDMGRHPTDHAGREAGGRCERAVAGTEEHGDGRRAEVGDREVGVPVAVHVADRSCVGGDAGVEAGGGAERGTGAAEHDEHLTRELTEDEVGVVVSVDVTDGHAGQEGPQRLAHGRAEGSVARAGQHRDPERIDGDDVEVAVGIYVRHRAGERVQGERIGHRCAEGRAGRSEEHRHRGRGRSRGERGDGEVGIVVVVEVSGRHRRGRAADCDRGGGPEDAGAHAPEHRHASVPGVGRDHVEPAVAVDIGRDDRSRLGAHRVLRGRKIERIVGVRRQRREHHDPHDCSCNDDAVPRRPPVTHPEHLRLL